MYGPEPYHRGSLRVIKHTGSGKVGGYDIRTVPTIHSQKVKSQGIIVSRDGKTLLYTGDLIWIKRWYHRYFRDLDLVITEGSFIRRSGMVRRDIRRGNIYGHAGIGRLISTFSEHTGHIVLTHFGSWLYKDIKEARKRIREIARREGVEVTVGYDGLEITI
jgi:ribonuclease BN (tRNA processing enzyme)